MNRFIVEVIRDGRVRYVNMDCDSWEWFLQADKAMIFVTSDDPEKHIEGIRRKWPLAKVINVGKGGAA